MSQLAKSLAVPPVDEDYAHKMGYRCAIDGANEVNCHFSIFARPELTRAWEQGKLKGELRERRSPSRAEGGSE